ncbi:phage tail protein [Atlantibacter hermannii]|uniref:phage tail protein n=2 Tax=Atlantibacter hermannii TaxID=565 RepID=UPI002914BE9C|nr:phage tail protein [Atlantibacter hermannii]MDU7390248.1 phage tail protein [Atlantibacter hermannii]
MTAKYYAILTTLGAAKLANAMALGTKLEITTMAVGDGGGVLPTPDASQTAIVGEQRRAPINMLSIDPANPGQIIAEQVIPENEGGFWIRTIGLYDKDGTLIAVANCPETYKPQLQEGSGRTQTIRMILIVSNTDAITLKIDPSVVLATRKYVDDRTIEVKVYADDLMAAHLDAANPHNQYAPKASPALTGTPTAPTPVKTDNTTKLATTAHVKQVVADYAPLANPALSGKPTAPTAAQTSNDTQLATTAFVKAAITALIDSSPAAMDTLNELAAALGNDPNFATTMTNLLAAKAPLTSPALTGTPTAPTAAQTVNNTQLATTAFVKAAVAALLASPAFTGTPTAPTAAQTVNNTQIATTAYVKAALAALVDSSPSALDTLNELAAALNDDPNFAATMTTELSKKMDKASNGADIPDIAAFLSNLGLKEAAKRAVGTGAGQIPDMSAFEYVGNASAGYVKLPNGFKLQWLETGKVPAGTTGVGYWAYPLSVCLFAIAVPVAVTPNTTAGNVVAGAFSNAAVELHNWGQISASARIIGIGR